MKMPVIEVTQNVNVAADHMSDPAVFAPRAAKLSLALVQT